MSNNTWRIVIIPFVLIMLVLTGCDDYPKHGQPGYQDPMDDPSPYYQADEYLNMLDYQANAQRFIPTISNFAIALAEISGDDEFREFPEEEFLEIFTFPWLDVVSETAKANDSMVHARGEYMLNDIAGETGMIFSQFEPAEVKLPEHFPVEKWDGHIFLANLDDYLEFGLTEIDAKLQSEMGQESENMGMMGVGWFLQMMGLEGLEDIYGWMGDEFLIAILLIYDVDSDFNPAEGDVSAFGFTGIACEDPEWASRVFSAVTGLAGMFLGLDEELVIEKPEIEGYDTFLVPLRTIVEGFIPEDDEEYGLAGLDQETISQIRDILIAVGSEYIFIGEEAAIKAVTSIYEEDAVGSGRFASLEIQTNFDSPQEANEDIQHPNIPDESELPQSIIEIGERFESSLMGFGPLGTTRTTVVLDNSGDVSYDILISKEAIDAFDVFIGKLQEVDISEWQEIIEFGIGISGHDFPFGIDADEEMNEVDIDEE